MSSRLIKSKRYHYAIWALVPLIVGGIAITTISVYTGKRIEQALPFWVADMNEQLQASPDSAGYSIQLVDLESHLFSTQLTIALHTPHSETATVFKDIDIEHGPFPSSALLQWNFKPQMARLHYQTDSDFYWPKPWFAPLGEQPSELFVQANYDQSYHWTVQLNQMQIQALERDIEYEHILVQGEGSQNELTVTLKSDSIALNHHPLSTLAVSVTAMQEKERREEQLSISFQQSSPYGQSLIESQVTAPSLFKVWNALVLHHFSDFLKQVQQGKLHIDLPVAQLAYLLLSYESSSEIDTAQVQKKSQALIQAYQKMDFKLKLLLELIPVDRSQQSSQPPSIEALGTFSSHIELNELTESLTINGASLPLKLFH